MATWSVRYRLPPPNSADLRNIDVEADDLIAAIAKAEARLHADAVILACQMVGSLCSDTSTAISSCQMRRETTNRLRYILEDLLPPALRDSILFKKAAELAWGKYVQKTVDFRHRAPFLTEQEYEALYSDYPKLHGRTDNSEACVVKIVDDVVGESVCDVGCGKAYVLSRIRDRHPATIKRLVGVDFIFVTSPDITGVEFRQAKIEALPFRDGEFDTVICTHVLEHILDYRRALAELRRIAHRRLIIVVPLEREALYNFNNHLQFFPYVDSFLRAIIPVPPSFECLDIGRDIYYREDI